MRCTERVTARSGLAASPGAIVWLRKRDVLCRFDWRNLRWNIIVTGEWTNIRYDVADNTLVGSAMRVQKHRNCKTEHRAGCLVGASHGRAAAGTAVMASPGVHDSEGGFFTAARSASTAAKEQRCCREASEMRRGLRKPSPAKPLYAPHLPPPSLSAPSTSHVHPKCIRAGWPDTMRVAAMAAFSALPMATLGGSSPPAAVAASPVASPGLHGRFATTPRGSSAMADRNDEHRLPAIVRPSASSLTDGPAKILQPTGTLHPPWPTLGRLTLHRDAPGPGASWRPWGLRAWRPSVSASQQPSVPPVAAPAAQRAAAAAAPPSAACPGRGGSGPA
jgi:hypothetical protein